MRIVTGTVLLACLVFSAHADEGATAGCLVNPGDLSARPDTGGLAIIDLPGGPAGVDPTCSGPNLQSLAIRLPVGSRQDMTLFLGSASNGPRSWQATSEAGEPIEWIVVEPSRRHADSLVVRIRSPRGATAGDRVLARLVPALDSAASDFAAIPLRLELVEEAPMFRDQFDVDPVIGQFSLVL